MPELTDFYNHGLGWICRHCEAEFEREKKPETTHPLVLRESEAESKESERANRARARWTDKTQRFLICPRCGITEAAEKS